MFKAFYAQAAGQVPGYNNPFGEILRFVVLRPHKRHSICLQVHPHHVSFANLTCFRAIHTYQNQGTTARHARARDHVVIYTGERRPPLVPGEDVEVLLKRDPIKVTLDQKGEPLLPASRLSLAKLYTIEHNIPTFPVGKISSRDVENVKQYCIEVQGLFASPNMGSQALPEIDEDEEDEDEDDG